MVGNERKKQVHVGWPLTPGVVIAISLGAAFGSLGREGLALLFNATGTGSFPWGTLVANLTGAFLLGLMATCIDRLIRHRLFRPFWEIGVVRSYTTLSTFSLESIALLEAKAWTAFIPYVAVSVFGGLLCIWLGDRLGTRLSLEEGTPVDTKERDRVEEEI